MMMSVRGRFAVVLLLLSSAAGFAQTRPLNPTVRVLARATTTVPEDCDEGVAQQPIQRAQREELPIERDTSRDLEPPPSHDLRSQLQAAQSAAERTDRESFRAAVDAAKSLLSTYPPGGERTAASEALGIYNDLHRLWEYQFTSPTGAFFTAETENGALLNALRKYRGYEESIRPQTLDVSGTRFYPTRESRDFLVREAADRLTRLGFPPPPPRRAAPATVTREAPTRREPQPSSKPAVTRAEPRRTETTTRAETPRRKTTPAPVRRSSTPSRPRTATRSEPPPPAPATATQEEVPLPPAVVRTPATETASTMSPIVTETGGTATTETSTTTVLEAGTATDTTDTTITEVTATDAQTAATPRTRTRSVLLPLMLIIIGAGVLILLFRASS